MISSFQATTISQKSRIFRGSHGDGPAKSGGLGGSVTEPSWDQSDKRPIDGGFSTNMG